MNISRRFRPIVSIAFSLLLFAGLPGLAMADQSNVHPDISGGYITGVVTDDDGHGNLDAGGHEAGRWRSSNLDAGGHEIWTPPIASLTTP